MTSRVGAGLFVGGVLVTAAALFATNWNPARAYFELGFVLQASVLAVSLGAGTLVVDPETPTGVLRTTGIAVLGSIALSLTIVLSGGTEVYLLGFLSSSVIPYLPMVVGYTVGALRTVPELSRPRRRRIGRAAATLGLLVWFGSYQLFVITHDTTGESGYHSGFLMIRWVGILVGDLVAAGVLYLLWRLVGRTAPGPSDADARRSKPPDVEQ